mgnify:CR=1 FL=1
MQDGMQREAARSAASDVAGTEASGWASLLKPGTRRVLFVCCMLQVPNRCRAHLIACCAGAYPLPCLLDCMLRRCLPAAVPT